MHYFSDTIMLILDLFKYFFIGSFIALIGGGYLKIKELLILKKTDNNKYKKELKRLKKIINLDFKKEIEND